MRLMFLCMLFLTASASAQAEPGEEPELPEPEIPEEELGEDEATPGDVAVFPAGRISRAERDAPAVFVRLREGGLLRVKRGEEWKDASLSDLETWLREASKAHHEEMQRKGESGLEVIGRTLTVSKLFVSIEADAGTPWQHIQWLMTIAAEQRYYKIELAQGKRRMLAFLPCDVGIPRGAREAGAPGKVQIQVIARSEAPAKWGDTTVNRPTVIGYRLGEGEETEDLAVLAKEIAVARKGAATGEGVAVRGEIMAAPKVPFEKVLDVMAACADHDFAAVTFHGTSRPAGPLRPLPRLPYPIVPSDSED